MKENEEQQKLIEKFSCISNKRNIYFLSSVMLTSSCQYYSLKKTTDEKTIVITSVGYLFSFLLLLRYLHLNKKIRKIVFELMWESIPDKEDITEFDQEFSHFKEETNTIKKMKLDLYYHHIEPITFHVMNSGVLSKWFMNHFEYHSINPFWNLYILLGLAGFVASMKREEDLAKSLLMELDNQHIKKYQKLLK